VGAGAETKAWATNVPINVGPSVVAPNDIIMMDATERGAVCIPRGLLSTVLELLPKLLAADEKVVEDVKAGGTVAEAFKKHRRK
jgi:regulator of RNase E activity RraA